MYNFISTTELKPALLAIVCGRPICSQTKGCRSTARPIWFDRLCF